MLITAEARWFWKERPDYLDEWFVHSLNDDSINLIIENRTDLYYVAAEQNELGIKNRGSNPGVEIKGLVATHELQISEGVLIQIQIWGKWACSELMLHTSQLKTIEVAKKRKLRDYDMRAVQPVQVSSNETHPVGCSIELTELSIEQRNFWTFGIEAFGAVDSVQNDLIRMLKLVNYGSGSKLDNVLSEGRMLSYPTWLQELAKDTD